MNIDNPLMDGVEMLLRNPDGSSQWMRGSGGDGKYNAPNGGKYPVAHIETFMNRYSSLARVYRDYDEALLDSRDNARYMWNDVGIRECIDARKRMVQLLNWHVEPENEHSHSEREFCATLEKTMRRIRHFSEYRYVMQNAIWLGKMGIQHRWQAQVVNGRSVWMPFGRHQDDWGWRPLHGDKLVFRQARPSMTPGSYEGQLGIRVGSTYKAGDLINARWRVEPTDYGLAYFLSPQERRLLTVHKHHVEDAAFEDGLRAGAIHGVGIRSVIYWEWVQKQETMAFLMEFLERMSGGIQIWKYPQGNKQALDEVRTAAENYNSGQEHALLVPVPMGENGTQYGVDVVEPGFQGIETLQNLLTTYFNHRIKRYCLGQVLSSEAESTGLGSGVADLHTDTLLQIIKSDATMHEESLTTETGETIVKINVQKGVWSDPGFQPRIVLETEDSDIDKKLQAWGELMDRGIKFCLKDVYELAGARMPTSEDQVTPDPPGKGGAGGPGDPSMIDPKAPGGDPSQEQPAAGGDPTPAGEPGNPAKLPEQTQRYSRKSFAIPAVVGMRRKAVR